MSTAILKGNASGTGSMTLESPNTNSNRTVTVPDVDGQMMVSGAMPAFSYYQSVAQTLSANTVTKITFTTSEFDTTGGMYASSRFTPTIAGYYQITAGVNLSTISAGIVLDIYKNGGSFKRLTNDGSGVSSQRSGTSLIYFNGSTDYVEIYAAFGVGQNTFAAQNSTYFQGSLVRAA